MSTNDATGDAALASSTWQSWSRVLTVSFWRTALLSQYGEPSPSSSSSSSSSVPSATALSPLRRRLGIGGTGAPAGIFDRARWCAPFAQVRAPRVAWCRPVVALPPAPPLMATVCAQTHIATTNVDDDDDDESQCVVDAVQRRDERQRRQQQEGEEQQQRQEEADAVAHLLEQVRDERAKRRAAEALVETLMGDLNATEAKCRGLVRTVRDLRAEVSDLRRRARQAESAAV